jgi:hypothetical protein
LKYEENDTLNEELIKIYEQLNIDKNKFSYILQNKDDEIYSLINKINDLETTINRYGDNLKCIKVAYDEMTKNHKKELYKRNEELKQMKEIYEDNIREVKLIF